MRSFVIIEVEHGEHTDELDSFVSNLREDNRFAYPGLDMIDYAVKVDIPVYATAENVNTFIPS